MLEILSYGFLQRAILSGIFIGLACAILGVFLILRQDAMISHGLSHIAFAGVAVGLFLKFAPLGAAMVMVAIAAIAIQWIRERTGLYGDTAIAIFSSAGFAIGIILVTLSKRFSIDLFGFLFGDILAISTSEVWLSIVLAGTIALIVMLNYRQFLYITFDRESARVAGIKVNRLETLLSILTAITVVLGMKIVGILLVSGLLVIPAAAGLLLSSNFMQAMIISSATSFLSVAAGLTLSFCTDLPPSGTIVITSFILFGLFFLVKRIRK